MTLQNLSKILDRYDKELGSTSIQLLKLLHGLSFYNFDDPVDTKNFNHAIGLPQKNGQAFPLFDYEQLLYDTLQQHKHVWIKKATGLGVTEFMLRYMAWLCFQEKQTPLFSGSGFTDVHRNRAQDRVSDHPYRENEATV
jgi:hypothetical protein